MKTIKCPNCGKTIDLSDKSRWKPFCSERCRLIDLGAWADESHRIPGETVPESEADNGKNATGRNPPVS